MRGASGFGSDENVAGFEPWLMNKGQPPAGIAVSSQSQDSTWLIVVVVALVAFLALRK